jgi:hypothetical protein
MSLSLTNNGNLAISTGIIPANTGTCLPALVYEASSGKVQYASYTAKTFVIDHPNEENKFLVHACLEGPEAGVYYRGKAAIVNDDCVTIQLPGYVDKLAKNFTVHITQMYEEANNVFCQYKATDVTDNQFRVYGKNSQFFWIVYGERMAIDTEPNKEETTVCGAGPYTWI